MEAKSLSPRKDLLTSSLGHMTSLVDKTRTPMTTSPSPFPTVSSSRKGKLSYGYRNRELCHSLLCTTNRSAPNGPSVCLGILISEHLSPREEATRAR